MSRNVQRTLSRERGRECPRRACRAGYRSSDRHCPASRIRRLPRASRNRAAPNEPSGSHRLRARRAGRIRAAPPPSARPRRQPTARARARPPPPGRERSGPRHRAPDAGLDAPPGGHSTYRPYAGSMPLDRPPYNAAHDRYESMQYVRSGRSGLQLPRISLGLWNNFGSDRPLDTQRAILRRAFDLGVTHFDLANNYGPVNGAAERNFGLILHDDFLPYRDELIISTKAGFDMWPGPYGEWGSRKYLLSSLDQSLGAHGPRLRRHLLLAPAGSRDADRGDDGRARHGRQERQGALRRNLELRRRPDRRRGRRTRMRKASRFSSTSPATTCSTAGWSRACCPCSTRWAPAGSCSPRSRRAC